MRILSGTTINPEAVRFVYRVCRECEANALQMSKMDFNDDSEKTLVEQVFKNAMESLADDDRQLPQVKTPCVSLYLGRLQTAISRTAFLALVRFLPIQSTMSVSIWQ